MPNYYTVQDKGVGGGQKGKKMAKMDTNLKKIFPHKIVMLSDFLVLVWHNRHNTVG